MGALFGSLSALFIGMSDLFNRRVAGVANVVAIAITVQFVAVFVAFGSTFVVDSTFSTRDFALGALGGLGMAVGLGSYYGGVTRSSATVIAPTVGTLGAIIPFFYTVATGSRPSTLAWAGACIAFGGLLLITVSGGAVRGLRSGLMWGILSGCGYGFALSAIISASSESGSWPAVGQRLTAFTLSVGFAIATKTLVVPPRAVRPAMVAGGTMSGMASVTFLVGATSNATAAVITQSMFPAIAVLIGWLYYSDTVSRRQLVGLTAAIVGVAAVAAG